MHESLHITFEPDSSKQIHKHTHPSRHPSRLPLQKTLFFPTASTKYSSPQSKHGIPPSHGSQVEPHKHTTPHPTNHPTPHRRRQQNVRSLSLQYTIRPKHQQPRPRRLRRRARRRRARRRLPKPLFNPPQSQRPPRHHRRQQPHRHRTFPICIQDRRRHRLSTEVNDYGFFRRTDD